MSEIVLSTNTNYDDYSTNGSMTMMDINPGLVQKSSGGVSSPTTTNDFVDSVVANSQHQQYSTYPAYTFQSMPMGYPPVPTTNYPSMSTRLGYYDDNNQRHHHHHQQQQQPNSPESISSSSSTPSPPPTNTNTSASNNNYTLSCPPPTNELITPLSTSTSSSTTSSSNSSSNKLSSPTTATTGGRFNNPTTARVKEMITRANSVPMEFYHTEFLEYSKETYEKKMESRRNKRKRPACNAKDQQQSEMIQQQSFSKKQRIMFAAEQEEEEEEDDSDDEVNDHDEKLDQSQLSSAEIRRQIHIQSEQKRRAQIKQGFDELRVHLPGCNNKKMSKAALLTRTVQQLQHLKGMQNELLSEVERLLQENEALKKFQHGVLQRQAMENVYTF